ncbi:Txe/YoeB family addiction module toxin [Burkholderia sp. THE68]|uniref:Txe/YoeB family addiction module toxin n=1 Tax=Burkholderia sp. THE68 TaxID=758782 RepID=UPI001389D541|nr:Txe/YoeB family addiction module toxin [Burkholderia sp. THE68]
MMARAVQFSVPSWYHYHVWHGSDSKIFTKVTGLINECCRNPFKGTGKPEPLKYEKAWSRRIDEKNRFVYRVTDGFVLVISCRGHYGDK